MEKLQKQIQAVAKKTGISSAAKLAQVAKKDEQSLKYVPDVEWWDMALLPNHTYKDLTRILKNDEERYTGVTNLVEHPIVKDAPSKFLFLFCFLLFAVILRSLFKNFIFCFNSFMIEFPLYRNHSIDLQSRSMNWFLYDRDLRHERVNYSKIIS